MNQLKPYYVTPYLMGVFAVLFYSSYKLLTTGLYTSWLGAFISVLPAGIFFSTVLAGKRARTSANLPSVWIVGAVGAVVALVLPGEGAMAQILALGVGFFGGLLYVFWYSRFGDRSSSLLIEGKTLPEFVLKDENGNPVNASTIRQQPALLLFFRGNWCPLCMAQIGEIASQYKELDQRGVNIYLVSPQSESNTKSLAARFDVPMTFLIDEGSLVARQLGIIHEKGVPLGVPGYDDDTIMPTALLTDATGKILMADLTDNYRVRPEPETFLRIFDQHGINAV